MITRKLTLGVMLGLLSVALAPGQALALDKKSKPIRDGGGPNTRFHDQPVFLTDIGLTPDETLQTYSGDCTGIESCGDFFDVTLDPGDSLFLSLCPPDGTADFDTGLGIWDTVDLAGTAIAANDDHCGLQSELFFKPLLTSSTTFRVLVGTFDTDLGGTYTLAYQKPVRSLVTAGSSSVGGSLDVGGTAAIGSGLMVDGPISADGGLDVSAGNLRIPVTGLEPPDTECSTPPDYSTEGRIWYDSGNNVIWVCAPDYGGWNSLTLTPPAP